MNMYLSLQSIYIHDTIPLMLSEINLNTIKEMSKQVIYLNESTPEFIFKDNQIHCKTCGIKINHNDRRGTTIYTRHLKSKSHSDNTEIYNSYKNK